MTMRKVMPGDAKEKDDESEKGEVKKKDDESENYKGSRLELTRFVRNNITHVPDSEWETFTPDDAEILNAYIFFDLIPDLIQGILIARDDNEKCIERYFSFCLRLNYVFLAYFVLL